MQSLPGRGIEQIDASRIGLLGVVPWGRDQHVAAKQCDLRAESIAFACRRIQKGTYCPAGIRLEQEDRPGIDGAHVGGLCSDQYTLADESDRPAESITENRRGADEGPDQVARVGVEQIGRFGAGGSDEDFSRRAGHCRGKPVTHRGRGHLEGLQ